MRLKYVLFNTGEHEAKSISKSCLKALSLRSLDNWSENDPLPHYQILVSLDEMSQNLSFLQPS
jgi:hypothetical protein